MTGYEPNPHNAVLASDAAVVRAINSRDSRALADALESGGGSPGSIYLEHLLCALNGEWRVELVRKVRGRPKGKIAPVTVEPQWQERGLPKEVREQLVSGLRTGKLMLRRPRVTGRSAGRPAAALAPEAIDGSHIVALAGEIAKRDGLSDADALRKAKWLWIDEWRRERDLPAIRSDSEQRTAEKRANKAVAAFRKLKHRAEEMQG